MRNTASCISTKFHTGIWHVSYVAGATLHNAKPAGQPSKKANPLHNLYIMPTMAPQTSTYHLQNEKHSQLHLYKIPYWPKVNLENFSKKTKKAPTKSETAVRRCQKRSKRSPLQNGKGPYVDPWTHCCSTKWVSISAVDGCHNVEEMGRGIQNTCSTKYSPTTTRTTVKYLIHPIHAVPCINKKNWSSASWDDRIPWEWPALPSKGCNSPKRKKNKQDIAIVVGANKNERFPNPKHNLEGFLVGNGRDSSLTRNTHRQQASPSKSLAWSRLIDSTTGLWWTSLWEVLAQCHFATVFFFGVSADTKCQVFATRRACHITPRFTDVTDRQLLWHLVQTRKRLNNNDEIKAPQWMSWQKNRNKRTARYSLNKRIL